MRTEDPVFPAGGVYDGADHCPAGEARGSGGTDCHPVIATEECDAAPAYKQAMVDAKEEDVRIIKSPVGMPGRALFSPLIRKVAELGRIAPSRCLQCLRTCNPADTPYCITRAH